MFRPVFIFKVLICSVVINIIFFIYFLSQNAQHAFLGDSKTKNHYEVNDYYFLYKNNIISTNVKMIPMPMFVSVDHTLLILNNGFRIRSNQKATKDLQSAIVRYSKYISALTGFEINIDEDSSPSSNSLVIDCPSSRLKKHRYPKLDEDESYTLNITRTGIYLYSDTLTGIIRGLSTFIQLIEKDTTTKKVSVPYINVVDRPRFSWRGLMLDVCRHWMSMSVIKRTLNAMELSKLNVLHLHLSDDQGFRVESIRYPLLHDRRNYFSQKDIQYIIEYARLRRIRIVPEFDIPGHTTSWFVGYPDLASGPGPYQVETRWGVMQATMDPTRESTYTFLDGFFKEMTDLFPDPYFHIGGDEVEGTQWTLSPSIQKFIQERQLMNKNGLQAYFNKRIHRLLKKYNKIMVGWEEIIEEMSENLTISNDVVIQAWKSRKALINAINKGYRGLLSNGYYLDHLVSSATHYKIDPLLNDEVWLFNETQLSHILGGEACMWTEYVAENSIDSRIWPRVLAIAERFWSPSSMNNENFLYERLFRMNHLLNQTQTGVTHLSSYKQQLQKLILDREKKMSLLHPLVILADACEPGGFEPRSQTNRYSSLVPLTTFIDALQSENELIWKLETLPINDKKLRKMFHIWAINHIRLKPLFDDIEIAKSKQLWGQDIELLSNNLAEVGRIGLRVLDYGTKKVLHYERNNTMNFWSLMQWAGYHQQLLSQFENQVNEVRLAAVRPVRRLLKSFELTIN